jgi:GrpB-like predicted nucleotidyltransferase (UPF0157 family)
VPSAHDITRHWDNNPDEDPYIHGKPAPEAIEVVASDPGWPALYERLASEIRGALGPAALHIEHVGSTSVPGLPAKPVIDIDLTVADSRDEASYVAPLEALGYDLFIREPSWHEHRMLRLDEPRANLHVFSPDCPELVRHVLFRDWLRAHPDDRVLYADAKDRSRQGIISTADYNLRKEPVIREIYDRVFRAAGLLD